MLMTEQEVIALAAKKTDIAANRITPEKRSSGKNNDVFESCAQHRWLCGNILLLRRCWRVISRYTSNTWCSTSTAAAPPIFNR